MKYWTKLFFRLSFAVMTIAQGFFAIAFADPNTSNSIMQPRTADQVMRDGISGASNSSDNQSAAEDARLSRQNAQGGQGAAADSGPTGLASPDFKFNPKSLSPSTKEYKDWDKEGTSGGNTVSLLREIAQFLLVVVSLGAVIFITVGGFLMAISGGDTDRSTKGRTIITYNVQALVIALLAYGIIQFVIWILWGVN